MAHINVTVNNNYTRLRVHPSRGQMTWLNLALLVLFCLLLTGCSGTGDNPAWDTGGNLGVKPVTIQNIAPDAPWFGPLEDLRKSLKAFLVGISHTVGEIVVGIGTWVFNNIEAVNFTLPDSQRSCSIATDGSGNGPNISSTAAIGPIVSCSLQFYDITRWVIISSFGLLLFYQILRLFLSAFLPDVFQVNLKEFFGRVVVALAWLWWPGGDLILTILKDTSTKFFFFILTLGLSSDGTALGGGPLKVTEIRLDGFFAINGQSPGTPDPRAALVQFGAFFDIQNITKDNLGFTVILTIMCLFLAVYFLILLLYIFVLMLVWVVFLAFLPFSAGASLVDEFASYWQSFLTRLRGLIVNWIPLAVIMNLSMHFLLGFRNNLTSGTVDPIQFILMFVVVLVLFFLAYRLSYALLVGELTRAKVNLGTLSRLGKVGLRGTANGLRLGGKVAGEATFGALVGGLVAGKAVGMAGRGIRSAFNRPSTDRSTSSADTTASDTDALNSRRAKQALAAAIAAESPPPSSSSSADAATLAAATSSSSYSSSDAGENARNHSDMSAQSAALQQVSLAGMRQEQILDRIADLLTSMANNISSSSNSLGTSAVNLIAADASNGSGGGFNLINREGRTIALIPADSSGALAHSSSTLSAGNEAVLLVSSTGGGSGSTGGGSDFSWPGQNSATNDYVVGDGSDNPQIGENQARLFRDRRGAQLLRSNTAGALGDSNAAFVGMPPGYSSDGSGSQSRLAMGLGAGSRGGGGSDNQVLAGVGADRLISNNNGTGSSNTGTGQVWPTAPGSVAGGSGYAGGGSGWPAVIPSQSLPSYKRGPAFAATPIYGSGSSSGDAVYSSSAYYPAVSSGSSTGTGTNGIVGGINSNQPGVSGVGNGNGSNGNKTATYNLASGPGLPINPLGYSGGAGAGMGSEYNNPEPELGPVLAAGLVGSSSPAPGTSASNNNNVLAPAMANPAAFNTPPLAMIGGDGGSGIGNGNNNADTTTTSASRPPSTTPVPAPTPAPTPPQGQGLFIPMPVASRPVPNIGIGPIPTNPNASSSSSGGGGSGGRTAPSHREVMAASTTPSSESLPATIGGAAANSYGPGSSVARPAISNGGLSILSANSAGGGGSFSTPGVDSSQQQQQSQLNQLQGDVQELSQRIDHLNQNQQGQGQSLQQPPVTPQPMPMPLTASTPTTTNHNSSSLGVNSGGGGDNGALSNVLPVSPLQTNPGLNQPTVPIAAPSIPMIATEAFSATPIGVSVVDQSTADPSATNLIPTEPRQ